MATKYSEALLAVKYRVKIKKDGHILGGPMYALERGLKAKWLGVLFAIFAVVASFGIGNMVQSNAISMLLDENLSPSSPPWWCSSASRAYPRSAPGSCLSWPCSTSSAA